MKPNELHIREAVPDDFEEIARLISCDEAWMRYGIDFPRALKLIQGAEDKFYVAQQRNGIIGFYALRLNGMGNVGAYLRMIIVVETYRNRGIGKFLLNNAWELVNKKIPNLFLICAAENIKAQKFYEREGFKRVGILDGLVIPGKREVLFWKSAGR